MVEEGGIEGRKAKREGGKHWNFVWKEEMSEGEKGPKGMID